MITVKDSMLTFGIMLAPMPPWARFIQQARLVESLGFDKIWLPDHFVYPEEKPRDVDWFECWTSLSALAVQTHHTTIGTLVSSMTLRNPAVLARMAMTVDHISGGRMELGVGAGGVATCHRMTGVPAWDSRERSDRYAEFVEILDHMLLHEVTTYEGKYYNIDGAHMRPRPISLPRPTLNVAAHGDKSLRLAARYGDSWNSLSAGKGLTPRQTSDIVRQRFEKFCDFAVQEGRDPTQLGRTFCFGWTSDGLFRSMEAFYDAMGRYLEAGINDFGFIYVTGLEGWQHRAITDEAMLKRIALEGIPALRTKV